ncbi:hypothetical protein GCM10007857_76310 [Bradyrhizobium iriomotense]|uniref:Uncharacterized protein n=1 Tax=Bradyrhizobium iriomotense TaxID=441950 RepID=A0ABQ6BB42_9BRAD|nr:hypothetical protein GCM10007857_76310 [Bradyrhizobium iriomotense]
MRAGSSSQIKTSNICLCSYMMRTEKKVLYVTSMASGIGMIPTLANFFWNQTSGLEIAGKSTSSNIMHNFAQSAAVPNKERMEMVPPGA